MHGVDHRNQHPPHRGYQPDHLAPAPGLTGSHRSPSPYSASRWLRPLRAGSRTRRGRGVHSSARASVICFRRRRRYPCARLTSVNRMRSWQDACAHLKSFVSRCSMARSIRRSSLNRVITSSSYRAQARAGRLRHRAGRGPASSANTTKSRFIVVRDRAEADGRDGDLEGPDDRGHDAVFDMLPRPRASKSLRKDLPIQTRAGTLYLPSRAGDSPVVVCGEHIRT